MPSQRGSRTARTGATTSQTSRSPANSGRAVARIKQEAEDDAETSAAQPSSPAVQVHALDSNHDQPASPLPAPVIRYFLAEYYRSGEYSDLKLVSSGVVRSVHRIIVCSESPVLKEMCSNLGCDVDRLELDQYDPETLDRVLDFCYRRTYSDGEYPETVASFLTEMTAEDVRDALEAPLVVLSDVEDPEWTAECLECDDSDGEDGDPDGEDGDSNGEDGDSNGEDGDSDGEEGDSDDEDGDESEYFPYTCDINTPLDYDLETVDEEPLVEVPFESSDVWELSQPPYEISLSANLKVYIAAKDLQIPSLQLLARERFAHTVQLHWARFAELPALIEQIYLRTDQSDPLRALICQIIAASYDSKNEMAFKTEIRELMARNGEFATEVLDTVLRMKSEWADME